jgi:hypothetical protein
MKIRVSITNDEEDQIELLAMEHGELQAGNLGVSLAVWAQNLTCTIRAESFHRNGCNTIVVQTLFPSEWLACAMKAPKIFSRRSVKLAQKASNP